MTLRRALYYYTKIVYDKDLLLMGLLVGPQNPLNAGAFYWHGLTLIPAWMSNHMPGRVWDEITYPFLNFNGCTVEV